MSLTRWFTRALRRSPLRRSPAVSLRPRLLALEDRLTPATLDVLAGGNLVYTGANVNNALGVSLAAGNYTFNDPQDPITLGAGAVTAGFTTSGGGATATGPSAGLNSIAINVGAGLNVVTLGTFDAALPALTVTSGSVGNSEVDISGPLTDTGAIALTGFYEITVDGAVAATGDIQLQADEININQSIATGGRMTITPTTSGQSVDLGGLDSPGALGLADAELDLVTAGTLAIGDASTGSISVTSNISQAGSGYSVLLLTTGGSITSAGGSIATSDLGLQSDTGINLQTSVTNLAFANTVSGAVVIANSGGLTLTPVGGIVVSQNAGTTIDVTTTGGLLVNQSVQAAGTITLTATDAVGAGQDLQVGGAISVISNGGDVNLRAGDNLALAADSHVQAAGTVALAVDFGNADAGIGASAIVPGSALFAPTATLTGDADDDTFNLSAGTSAPISVDGAPGADTLNFDALGQAVIVSPTTISAAGLQPVTFNSIASLSVLNAASVTVQGTAGDDAITIARGGSGVHVTVNAGGTAIVVGEAPLTIDGLGGSNLLVFDFGGGSPIPAGGLTLANISQYIAEGTAGDDVFDLQRSGGVSQFRINGGAFINLPGAQTFRIDGLTGNDTLHVIYSGGDPAPSGGVGFDGGTGNDALGVFGAGNTATYRPSATTPGDGTVFVDAGVIAFTNLAPVDITGMAVASVLLPGADDVLALDNGFDFTMGGATPALRVSGTSGGVPIETAAFFNNTTVLIDTTANDGNDTITVNSATAGNNGNLTINTGAGTDSITVNAGPGISVTGQLTIASVAINLNGPIASTGVGGGITLTNSGTLTIGGVAVSSQGPILQNGTGPVAISGNAIVSTNAGAITIQSAVTFTAGVTSSFASTGGGAISFASTLDGGGNLTITTAGLTTLSGAVGGGTALGSLTTNGGGTTAVNGGAVRTTGLQQFTDNVTVGAAATQFTSTGNADITFSGTLDGASDVVVTTGGATTFIGAIGGTTALSSLTTDGGGTTAINGGLVRTTNVQQYSDAVTVGAAATQFTSTGNAAITFGSTLDGASAVTVTTGGATLFSGAVGGTTPLISLTTNGGGTTAVNGGLVRTTGAQLYSDAVTVGAAATQFTSTGNGAITFASTLDGASNVTVTTGGLTTFTGAVGGGTALTSLTTNGGGTTDVNGGLVQTTGAQQYDDAVVLSVAVTQFTSTGNAAITFGSTLDGASATTITTGGTTTFGGAVGGTTALTSLTTNGGGTTAVNGGLVRTTGPQLFSDDATVVGPTTLFTSTGNAAITFGGALDGASAVTVTTSGLTTFAGAVGGTTPLTSLTTNGGGTTAGNGGLVRTTGAQSYADAVTVGAAATQFISTGNGAITFNGALDGASNVTVTTAGLTTFFGAVGGTTALTLLTTNGGGTTDVNGGLVQTTGAQQYDDAVVLSTAATLFISTGNGAITFGSTLDGASAVTVTTGGLTTFGGAVGGITPLTSLTTNGGGTTAVNGGLVRTTGAQLYGDAVTVGGPATQFVSTGGGAITFTSTLNGASAVTISTSGSVTLLGAVGTVTPLTSLTINGGGTADLNGGTITTTGSQTYSEPVVLTLDTVLNATNVTFAQTVNSDGTARSLLVNASGATIFGGAVGNTSPLSSLTTDAPGSTQINGGSVRTTGSQTYRDAVTLSAGSAGATTTTLIANAAAPGGITFGSTLNGATPRNQTLSLTANAGDINFNGAVGGTVELGPVTVNSAHNVTIAAPFNAFNIGQAAGTGATAFNGPTTLSGINALDITTAAISLNANVTASASGATVRFNPTAAGVAQAAGSLLVGAIVTPASGRNGVLFLNGTGGFSLNMATNDFGSLTAIVNGFVTVRDANDLTIVAPGIRTNNNAITLTTGRNFTAINNNFAVPFLDAGAAPIQVNPGTAAGATITLNAEVRGSTVTLGTDVGAPLSNAFPDLFVIRPSRNVPITVKGNRPSPLLGDPIPPGDRLSPIFTGIVGRIVLTPTGLGSGFYSFPDDTVKNLNFIEIENLVGFSTSAYSVQTGPTTYGIRTVNQQLGQTIQGGVSGGQVPANPFVVAPAIVNPFGPFGAPRIAFGDINGDGTPDLIIGNGPNNPPLVTVINGTALLNVNNISLSNPANILAQFYAYDPSYPGGVFVSAGDFNGDGRAEIVTGTDVGGGPIVRVLQYVQAGDPGFVPGVTTIYTNVRDFSAPGAHIPAMFNAYDPNFRGGVRVAVGDVNGDGKPDIVTGAGPGGGPHVKVFSGADGSVIRSFFAYAANFTGGVFVGAGDYNQDGKADILTGAGNGGAPHVEVFSGAFVSPTLLASFFALPTGGNPGFIPNPNTTTGVGSVAFTDANGDGQLDILVGTARGPQARALVFRGPGFTPILDPGSELLISPTLRDGANVAGTATAISGP